MIGPRPFAKLSLFALVLGAASCGHRENKHISNTKELADLEQAVCRAIKAKDVKKLNELIAPDFTFRNASAAPIGKADFLRNVEGTPAEIVSVACFDIEVQMAGDTAIVTGTQRAVIKHADGSTETGDGVFTDVFARRGRWQLIAAHGVELPSGDRTK